MEIINTEGLTKHFGQTKAIHNISIQINQGEIYGLLGLNGAGKTTFIRSLLGMIKPDEGKIKLFGDELNTKFNQWNNIGYLVETPYSYPNLSVYENLKVFFKLRQLQDISLIDNILLKLKLDKYRNIKANALSLGNQQRLGLAKALMHSPMLLILDEPINGLDPEGIVEVRELLSELANDGSTILLSSHILGEISKIASRIAIIHEGKLIKEVTTQQLRAQITRKVVVNTANNEKALAHLHAANYPATQTERFEIEIIGKEAIQFSEKITKLLSDAGVPPKQIYVVSEDLEMYFLRTIKEKGS